MSNGIPPPPVNRPPGGYLGFLDIKNGGRNPEQAVPVLQPVVDMTGWYAQSPGEYLHAEKQLTNTAAGGFSNFNTGDSLIVPSNEVWLVSHFGVRAEIPAVAGGTISFHPALKPAGTSDIVVLSATIASNSSAAGNIRGVATIMQAQYWWAQPGDELGTFLRSQEITGTVTYFAEVLIQRSRV